ncbi:hypothetical protein ACC786_14360 [Rhizobium ruizarguesonis]|uniref:hypothetical protein n=1 Tax=Rhizobium ruizarguesonis TaxID=2081791 RepID=UPI0018D548F5|nr:hypothetical protein [Rhizobium ruizarguesonis]
MSGLMQPRKLRERMLTWIEEEIRVGALPPRSEAMLTAILSRGELDRAELVTLLRTSDSAARRSAAALFKVRILQSETSHSPLRLAFPIGLAMQLLPQAFLSQDQILR